MPARVRDKRVCEAIEELTSADNRTPDIQALAGAVGLSRNQFTRLFLQEMGLPPYEYHLNLKLEKTRRRLQEDSCLSKIAHDFGFSDQSHFGRHFKRYFGVSPGAYASSMA